jgi:hypothetical protein
VKGVVGSILKIRWALCITYIHEAAIQDERVICGVKMDDILFYFI